MGAFCGVISQFQQVLHAVEGAELHSKLRWRHRDPNQGLPSVRGTQRPADQHFPGHGWYFELRINEVVTGWVGGLGIGVSLMSPSQITCLPDRAWRVPRTWIAGYWGRMFANGTQFIIDWKPQDLAVGDTVGFQVTPTGECVVYVNSISKVVFN